MIQAEESPNVNKNPFSNHGGVNMIFFDEENEELNLEIRRVEHIVGRSKRKSCL